MRKMRLELEALTVETFAPHTDEASAPGTVRAHGTAPEQCGTPPGTGIHDLTCAYLSCGGTCQLTGVCCNETRVDPECA
jgi:hypothetical protein